MSDFYDSLEDECEDKCFSSVSSYSPQGGTLIKENQVKKEESHGTKSHREDVQINNQCCFQNSKTNNYNKGRKSYSLPKLCIKGYEHNFSNILNILNRKGLSLNNDGSFYKSADEKDSEELPFVTRVYRNLQFEKRKLNKKINQSKNALKKKSNSVIVAKGEENLWSRNKICRKAKKKLDDDFAFGFSSNEVGKTLMNNNNLTDAMKRILLQKHSENSYRKVHDKFENLKKSKCVSDTSNAPKDLAENGSQDKGKTENNFNVKLPAVSPKAKGVKCFPKATVSEKEIGMKRMKDKFSKKKIPVEGNLSDLSLYGNKSQLTYLERHLKETGFDPLSLKYKFKKCLSDTNRSNYGDSVAGELPEISSRVLTSQNVNEIDEDEEEFYHQLIENDKKNRMGQNTTRSESRIDTKKNLNIEITSVPQNIQKEFKYRKKISAYKNSMKLIGIDDTPTEVSPIACLSRKNYHICSEPSSRMSKSELAFKGKAYGMMVNARNVFQMKNKSMERKNIIETNNSLKKTIKNSKNENQNSFKNNDSASAKSKFSLKRVRNISCDNNMEKNENMDENYQKLTNSNSDSSVFPPLSAISSEGEFTTEILQRMRNCLSQDIPYYD